MIRLPSRYALAKFAASLGLCLPWVRSTIRDFEERQLRFEDQLLEPVKIGAIFCSSRNDGQTILVRRWKVINRIGRDVAIDCISAEVVSKPLRHIPEAHERYCSVCTYGVDAILHTTDEIEAMVQRHPFKAARQPVFLPQMDSKFEARLHIDEENQPYFHVLDNIHFERAFLAKLDVLKFGNMPPLTNVRP